MRAPGDVAALARTSLDGAVGSLRLDDAGAPVDPLSADDKTLLEHALCRVMFGLIEEASARATAVMSHVASSANAKKGATDKRAHLGTNASDEPSMPRLLDLALTLSETGVVEPACVFNALEQLVETCTIADCEDVFTWVEARRGRLSADALWRRGKLVMLRTCNELQRTLAMLPGNVTRIVVGHTIQPGEITNACDGAAWRIDIGMSRGTYGTRPQVLEILPGGRVKVRRAAGGRG